MNKSKYALLIGFLCMIFGLGILSFLEPDDEYSFYENRNLAQKPVPTLETYKSGEYFDTYDSYYTEQFIGRQTWIRLYNEWNYMLPSVYKKSFYVQDDNTMIQKPMPEQPAEYYKPFTKQVNGLGEFIKEQNSSLYFFLAPAKSHMLRPLLPDYMPQGGYEENEKKFLSQLDDQKVTVENLSSWFSDNYTTEERKQFFFKSDHHWNMEGAFVTYQLMMERLQKDLPELGAPYKKEEITKTCAKAERMYGSWAAQLALVVDTTDDLPCHYLPKNFDFTDLNVYLGAIAEKNKKEPFELYGGYMNKEGKHIKYADAYTYDYSEINILNDQAKNDLNLLVLKDSYFNPVTYHVASHVKKLSVLDMRFFDPNKLQDYIKANKFDAVVIFHNQNNLGSETYRYGIK